MVPLCHSPADSSSGDIFEHNCRAGELGSRDEVAHKAGALADSVLNVAADCNDAALQRSAAEIFAFAACIGSTPFAAGLVRTLVQALADSPSAPRQGFSLLRLHCCGTLPALLFSPLLQGKMLREACTDVLRLLTTPQLYVWKAFSWYSRQGNIA